MGGKDADLVRNVLVLGAGAMGCYFAARLIEAERCALQRLLDEGWKESSPIPSSSSSLFALAFLSLLVPGM